MIGFDRKPIDNGELGGLALSFAARKRVVDDAAKRLRLSQSLIVFKWHGFDFIEFPWQE
jgi:hypothetical protein